MNHFTNRRGFNGIRSMPNWNFVASTPPKHSKGAYFTTLGPSTPALAARLGIPKEKLEYVFQFVDIGDLKPLPGGRGQYVFYSEEDYLVVKDRQLYSGTSEGVR